MVPRRLIPLLALLLASPAPGFRGDGARRFREGKRLLAEAGRRPAGLRAARRELEAARAQAFSHQEEERVLAELLECQERLVEALEGRDPEAHLAALEALEELAGPDASRRLERAEALVALGRPGEALELLREVFEGGELPGTAAPALAGRLLLEVLAEQAQGRPGAELDEALRLGPRVLELHEGRARARLERLLGRAALASRRFPEAVEYLEAAERELMLDAPDRRQLLLARGFLEGRDRGVVTEASPDSRFRVEVGARVSFRAAEALRETLARAHAELGAALGHTPERPLLVRVLVDADYRRLLSPHTLAITEETGEMVLRATPGATLADMRVTLRHELVHYLLGELARPGQLPRWFHEGLAQCLEVPGGPGLGAYKRALAGWRARSLPDPAQVLAFRPRDFGAARAAYDSAGLVVRQLLDEHGLGGVTRLAEDVAGGAAFAEAFRERTARTPEEYLLRWRRQLLDQIRDRIRAARGEDRDPDAEEPGLWIAPGVGP